MPLAPLQTVETRGLTILFTQEENTNKLAKDNPNITIHIVAYQRTSPSSNLHLWHESESCAGSERLNC